MRSEPRAGALHGRSAAIAAVVSGNDSHVGMAAVLGPRHLLTCAHVVNEALGHALTSSPSPPGTLRVQFPLAQVHAERLAEVRHWVPVGRGSKPGDLALLELAEGEPDIGAEVGYADLANVTGRTTDQDRFSVYGIAGGGSIGQHLQARFVGAAGAAMTQIESVDKSGQVIRPGFSGACIFDEREQAIVGMVQRVKVNTDPAQGAGPAVAKVSTAALALGTAQLAALVPGLRVEKRGRPAWFPIAWPLAALLLLLASVSHFWASQGGRGLIAEFALEGEHLQLAAFLGMHVLAILGPGVAWLLYRYSSDFSLSHWSRRIPPFPFCRESWRPGRRVAMSATVIALFVILPVYAQGHFLRKFHGQGEVFAHVATFDATHWSGIERDCVVKGKFCRHPQAGRYSLMPGAGSFASHFDYAYVYGEHRTDATREALTFFPVVQPLVLLALSATWLALLLRWGISAWSPIQQRKRGAGQFMQ
jgi:hypothetical protein